MSIVFIDAWIVSALVENPLFFTWCQFSLELTVISANHPLQWIIVAISEVISSFRNSLGSLDIVRDKGQTVWTKTFENLSVETSIFVCGIAPILVLKFQIVIEEVVSLNKLASVPLCNVTSLQILVSYSFYTYTIRINQCSISVEFSFIEIALINDSVGECELAITFLPVMLFRTLVLATRPLRHFV